MASFRGASKRRTRNLEVPGFDASHRPGTTVKGETSRDGAEEEQTKSDPASADQAGGRQHAVAGFLGARAEPDAAGERAGSDLLARHDGRAAGHRLRP